jgi:prevent-host-death family protein
MEAWTVVMARQRAMLDRGGQGHESSSLENRRCWVKLTGLSSEGVMRTINIHEAKTNLSRLVDQAAGGEPFVIAKAGKPMVKVVPLNENETTTGRRFDFLKGEIEVPDDFDTMGQDEIIRMFEDKP